MVTSCASGYHPGQTGTARYFRPHNFLSPRQKRLPHRGQTSSPVNRFHARGQDSADHGGASGIGKATASKFIENGAKAHELGPNASFIQCDVTKESDDSNSVDLAISKHGRLDILYNNVGVACWTSNRIIYLNLDKFDSVMAINVRGVLAGIKHAARVMIPRHTSYILCTARVTGVMGGMAQHSYSVSKSVVIGVVRSAAAELVVCEIAEDPWPRRYRSRTYLSDVRTRWTKPSEPLPDSPRSHLDIPELKRRRYRHWSQPPPALSREAVVVTITKPRTPSPTSSTTKALRIGTIPSPSEKAHAVVHRCSNIILLPELTTGRRGGVRRGGVKRKGVKVKVKKRATAG
ncbi:Short-chain dehydrogenase reductase 2a-like protein [Drosera capensis]